MSNSPGLCVRKCVMHVLKHEIQMTHDRGKNQLGVKEMLREAGIGCVCECSCCPQMPSLLTIDHSAAGLVVLF